MTGRYARTIVAAGLLLAGLLVLVAVAARGQLGDERSSEGHAVALPGGAFAWIYAGLLVGGVLALPFFFYMYVRDTPYSRTGRRRARLAPFWIVGFVALGVFVATRWGDQLRDAAGRLRFWGGGGASAPGAPGTAAAPPAPEWVPLVVVAGLVLAAVGGYLAWRAVRRRLRKPSLAASLTDALDDTLDDVAAEPDPRRAIILAYARMEAALDRNGCTRHEADAPLEYLARVLGELEVPAAPVETLTELFERAKFSHHPLGQEARVQALDALAEVRAELAAQG